MKGSAGILYAPDTNLKMIEKTGEHKVPPYRYELNGGFGLKFWGGDYRLLQVIIDQVH